MDKFETAFAVTAWFETGYAPYTNPSGNFDGQGLSWGPRQTCIGQGSLQPLLRRMFSEQPAAMAAAFGPSMGPVLADISRPAPTSDQLAKTIKLLNDAQGRLLPDWRAAFAQAGAIQAIQVIFQDDARGSIPAVDQLASWIALGGAPTLREWCLAYDIVTQDGGFNPAFRASISAFLAALTPFQKDSRDRMRAICWLRAGWVYIRGNRAFANDVLGRKLLIVEGRGRFRGEDVDLDARFSINDNPAV